MSGLKGLRFGEAVADHSGRGALRQLAAAVWQFGGVGGCGRGAGLEDAGGFAEHFGQLLCLYSHWSAAADPWHLGQPFTAALGVSGCVFGGQWGGPDHGSGNTFVLERIFQPLPL